MVASGGSSSDARRGPWDELESGSDTDPCPQSLLSRLCSREREFRRNADQERDSNQTWNGGIRVGGIDFGSEDCRPFKVKKVLENSPAAEAGIQTGDEIVALDGRPFKEIPSFEMEKLLSKNGAEYSLTLSRAGKELVVRIKLRRLL